jgi:phosphotransferase system HPr (HPr) family protein
MISQELLRCKVIVANPQGLHMRPATAFAELARQFQSTVIVANKEQRADGKSWLDLMLLVALPGTELTLEVAGSDAQAALPALAEALTAVGTDDEAEPAVPPKG